jgi:hypothetical protein
MSALRGTSDIVFFAAQLLPKINMELWFRALETPSGKDHTYSPIRLSCKSKEAIMQAIQHTEISRQGSNLFSAREVAQTIGADLETINEWLEVGAIDRAVFGGGRFSKYELQRAALTLELVKLGLAPSCARTVVWEMEYDLQQIWGEAISKQYKAYAIVIPNKQKKWLVFWCWKTSTQEIEPSTRGDIILPVSDILARVAKSG